MENIVHISFPHKEALTAWHDVRTRQASAFDPGGIEELKLVDYLLFF